MEIQYVLFVILVLGIIFSRWMLVLTSKRIHQERNNIIRNKVISIGGNIINIEQVDRKECPFNIDYKDVDTSYKFFKLSYTLEDKLKDGWAIIAMKQNWYGPNGAIDAKWLWHLD